MHNAVAGAEGLCHPDAAGDGIQELLAGPAVHEEQRGLVVGVVGPVLPCREPIRGVRQVHGLGERGVALRDLFERCEKLQSIASDAGQGGRRVLAEQLQVLVDGIA